MANIWTVLITSFGGSEAGVQLRKNVPLLAIATVLLLGCNNEASKNDDGKLTVLTTFTVIADMARNVAGDAATVLSVTKPGAEIHNYQPTPKDIAKAKNVDLILWNGMNLELWFNKFLSHLDNVPQVVVTDGIVPMGINTGPYTGKPNPHAWMSPTDAQIYIDNISAAMAIADPENADTYQRNAEAYKAQVTETIEPLKAQIAAIDEKRRWLVTSEGAFSYLARDFGLKELFLWPINADAQGTPKQVKAVIDTMRSENISAVFSESTVSDKPAKQVARETGSHYGGVLYVDSLSKSDGPVPSYLDLLRVTTQTIVDGLQHEGAAQ
ncbi:MAG: metal ABC transporter substrate-binding protein [Granulosicoccaceae bacterium]